MTKKFIGVALICSLFIWTMNTLLIAHAAALTALSDTMSEQTINTASSHVIKFTTPTGVTANGQTIVVTFPSGFNFTGKAISGLTLTYGASTGLEQSTTIAAAPGAGTQWGAVFSGTNNVVLTLTSPTATGPYIAAGNKVILIYSSLNSINPSSAANYTTTISANGDTGSITVPIITNDQVAITATVAQTLTFSISSNTINFGTLSSGATTYATNGGSGQASEPASAHTISAGTNATSGYSIALSGSTLTYGANTIAAIPGASAAALAPGTAQFGIRTTAAGGTGSVTAPFNGTVGNYGFGTSPLSSQAFASAAGVTATTTYSVNYAANIATLTPAGNYATTLTYVATSNF
jgi:hypothetical protein